MDCFLATVSSPSKLDRFYESVKMAPVTKPSSSRTLNAIRLSFSTRTTSPDIIHLVGVNALAFAPAFKLLKRKGNIVRHVFTSYDPSDRAVRPIRWLTNTLFIESYAFTTPMIGEWTHEGSPRTRRFLVRPPINCDLYKPLGNQPRSNHFGANQKMVLYMGPLWGSRFPAVRVFSAMRHLNKMGVEAHLLILTSAKRSSQSDVDKLLALSRNVGLDGQVTVRRVDLSEEERVDAYNAADIVIFPYVGPVPERLADPPFGILEAMACGRIVLATDVLSISEVIADGKTGFMVSDGSADEIARGIRRALTTQAETEIERNARERILADFSYPKVRETLIAAYSSISE
jgi:glycosyltransferase involved in cell wall biosynthesis